MLTSVQNKQVKEWYKLKSKKGRKQTNAFMVEGFHLVEEAHKSNWKVKEIIIREDVEMPSFGDTYPVTTVSSTVFHHLSATQTPQGIAAIVEIKENDWSNFDRVLMLDGLQDPGNVGTIIRTADAAGFDSIMFGDGTVDLFNDKVVRSTQGSLFHLPIFQANLTERIPTLREEGFRIWGAALQSAVAYTTIQPQPKTALIVGNEGAGIRESLLSQVDDIVKIPIHGQAESLNVSIATGILLYYIHG